MDIVFAIIGFLLGLSIAKTNQKDPSKSLEHLQEENKRLTDDIAYYKKLCKSVSEENIQLRRNQK